MTPQEYCARLEGLLYPMPPEERQEIIRYYMEFLEEADEAERLSLGSPEELAEKVLRENGIPRTPTPPLNPTPCPAPQKGNTAVKIILLVLTSPIWFSLLIAFFAVIFSLLISLIAVFLSLAIALPASVTAVFLTRPIDVPYTLFSVGCGLICGGLALLLWRPVWLGICAVCKGAVFVTKKLFQAVFS